MRRVLVLAAVLGAVALALAGCGSSSSANGPRDSELSYFAAGSPVVALISTDQNGTPAQNARGFEAHFPLARFALAAFQNPALQSRLAAKIPNFQQYLSLVKQIKPLLGNPLAIGSATASTASPASRHRFLAAFIATDAGKLSSFVGRIPAIQSAGSYDGAKLYQVGSIGLAVDGTTLLLSGSPIDVKSALDVHAHHHGIDGAAYDKALAGLPQSNQLAVYGNLSGLLSTPQAAKARLVPWVAAIRSYALTLNLTATGANASFRIDTSGSSLTAAQLPLAPGSSAPSVASQAPAAAGIKQLAHLIAFGQAAARAVDPAAYAKLIEQGAKEGVDLSRDIVSQFTGAAEVDYAPGGVVARVDVRDPAAARRTLAKLKKFKGVGGGFYESKTSHDPARVGIVGSRLVIGHATAAQLRSYAGQPATPIAGAPGPIAFRVAVGTLISRALAAGGAVDPHNPEIQALVGMLGDLSGYASDDPSGLHGSVTLPLK
ncbi:MAG: hypothetical protein ACR2IP_02555 [Solirubrobacteraceae bacterium]